MSCGVTQFVTKMTQQILSGGVIKLEMARAKSPEMYLCLTPAQHFKKCLYFMALNKLPAILQSVIKTAIEFSRVLCMYINI